MFQKTKRKLPGTAAIDETDGSLCIVCEGCERFPDPSSRECICCICEAVSSCGTSDRIRLAGVKDTEISGEAAEVLCRLAGLGCPSLSSPGGRRCARCPRSPENILDSLWSSFPDMQFSGAISRLYSDRCDGPECAGCLQRTFTVLTECDTEMRKISGSVNALAGRL